MRRADVAVIGAGMIGASAALAVAEAGHAVVLVGPGEPDDKRNADGPFASHYDEGRITRINDPDPLWAAWAAGSIDRYAEIEARSGIVFHAPVGSIRAAPPGAAAVVGARASMLTHGAPIEVIDGAGLSRRCPAIALPDDFDVIWEDAPAGYVNPRRMVAALRAVAALSGARLEDAAAVAVRPAGNAVQVTLADGATLECGSVLVATGPHARDRRLLPVLPDLAAVGRTIVLFEVSAGIPQMQGLPSFIVDLEGPSGNASFYGVPPVPYPGGGLWLKAGASCVDSPLDGPTAVRDWFHAGGSQQEAALIRAMVLRTFPGLAAARWRTEPCALVETCTSRPFIGRVPGCETIGIALGCNGYAAKSCIALGRIAAGMILDDAWERTAIAGPLRPVWRMA